MRLVLLIAIVGAFWVRNEIEPVEYYTGKVYAEFKTANQVAGKTSLAQVAEEATYFCWQPRVAAPERLFLRDTPKASVSINLVGGAGRLNYLQPQARLLTGGGPWTRRI